MITLGIETSCDETALALIETRGFGGDFQCRVIQSLVHSQADLHSAYGGVYPSLAKREHGKNLLPLLHKLLIEAAGALTAQRSLADEEFKDALEPFRVELQTQNPELWESLVHADFLKKILPIERIAVTEGPGLEPALWVGINFARVLATLWKVPVVPVNHMEGHVLGSLLPSDAANGAWQKLFPLTLPAVALLISGGHTELVEIGGHFPLHLEYQIMGQTKDDAVGEAFDKVARLLGLPYPGGPHIAMLSHQAYEEKIPAPIINGAPLSLPRPMLGSGDFDFSFSGLKTAVLYAIRDWQKEQDGSSPPDELENFKKGLSHEFEMAVAETLESKLRAAIDQTAARSVIVGGGVSANHVLRERFQMVAAEYAIPLYLPSRHISGDNALMIALAGAIDERKDEEGFSSNEKPPRSRELRAHGTKRLGGDPS